MSTLKVLIADDHDIVRKGLRMLIEEHPGWEVCGEARSGREAVEQAVQLRPDVTVIDISMPDLNGLEATRQIRKACPRTEVLVITHHDSDEMAGEVLDAGARGYVLKSDSDTDLVQAVEALSQHKPFFTARVTEIFLANRGSRVTDPAESMRNRLTMREREILQLLAEGAPMPRRYPLMWPGSWSVRSKGGVSSKTSPSERRTSYWSIAAMARAPRVGSAAPPMTPQD